VRSSACNLTRVPSARQLLAQPPLSPTCFCHFGVYVVSVSTTLFLKAGPRNASHRLRPRRADTPLVNVSEDLVGNGIPKVRRHRASQIAPGLPAARSGTPLNQVALKRVSAPPGILRRAHILHAKVLVRGVVLRAQHLFDGGRIRPALRRPGAQTRVLKHS